MDCGGGKFLLDTGCWMLDPEYNWISILEYQISRIQQRKIISSEIEETH